MMRGAADYRVRESNEKDGNALIRLQGLAGQGNCNNA